MRTQVDTKRLSRCIRPPLCPDEQRSPVFSQLRSPWYALRHARHLVGCGQHRPGFALAPLVALLLLCGTVSAAGAQSVNANRKRLPGAQACDTRFKLVELRVQDSSGAPVAGVMVSLRREGQTEAVRMETTSGLGLVSVADDGELSRVAKQGTAYTITLRKSGKTRRIPIRLGADSAGCHISMLSGPKVVTF